MPVTGRVISQSTVPAAAPRRTPPLRACASFDRGFGSAIPSSRRPPLRGGVSLDQGAMGVRRRRPPLLHTTRVDHTLEETEFVTKPSTNRNTAALRQKPLSAEESCEKDNEAALDCSRKYISKSEEICLDENRDQFNEPGNSFDSSDTNDPDLRTGLSLDLFSNTCDSYGAISKNWSNDYLYNKAGPSNSSRESSDGGSTFKQDGEFEVSASISRTSGGIRRTRLGGISDQRTVPRLVKQSRIQRLSSSSLQQVQEITYKDKKPSGQLQRSQRLSASALDDSMRLSSVQLFEKFCSEDFGSLYGHSDDPEDDYEEWYYYDNNPTTSKSEDSMRDGNFDLYEDEIQELELESIGTSSHFDRYCSAPPSNDAAIDAFIFDAAIIHHATPSTPVTPATPAAISRDSETETSFNDDFIVSSFNDDFLLSSLHEDIQLSPNLETLIEGRADADDDTIREDLFYDEEKADHISDNYEPCFGFSILPKRRSIKKEMLPTFKERSWDLSTLDLRPIDDDSPGDLELNSTADINKHHLANIDETLSIGNDSCSPNTDSEKNITKPNNESRKVSIASRLSMQKLQPFCLRRADTSDENDDMPPKTNGPETSGDARKRTKPASTRRARCFPL